MGSGYWQVAVDELDREKTVFVILDGFYAVKVMPFVLCNAPSPFERMMDSLLFSISLCYHDDIVVYAPTFDEHLQYLTRVLTCMRQANLRLNTKKCHLSCLKLEILRHVVDSAGVRSDPEKTRAVANFPTPGTVKDIRSFLGLCLYIRHLIQGFSEIAKPLTKLLSKDMSLIWGPEQSTAFSCLKIP